MTPRQRVGLLGRHSGGDLDDHLAGHIAVLIGGRNAATALDRLYHGAIRARGNDDVRLGRVERRLDRQERLRGDTARLMPPTRRLWLLPARMIAIPRHRAPAVVVAGDNLPALAAGDLADPDAAAIDELTVADLGMPDANLDMPEIAIAERAMPQPGEAYHPLARPPKG